MNLTSDVFLPAEPGERNPWVLRPRLMLSGAGQCTETVHAMQRMQGDGQKPALVALYEGISGGVYRQNPDIFEAHTLFPGAVLQIGLQLPLFSREGLLALAQGDWAGEVRRMAEGYGRIRLPILLRIGYEFDGVKWNGYDPQAYALAYRAIAEALAQAGATNVALVWDSYTTDTENAMDWFPGADVVDWYGYNTLAPKFSGPNLMAEMAQAAGKPLMNGEASYAEGIQDMPFAQWVQGYFRSMREARVAAYQYINWRWQVYPGAANWSHWADGRITEDPEMAAQYRQAMQGEDMVYRDETYAQPLMLSIDCGRALCEGMPDAAWEPQHDHATAEDGFGYAVQGAVASHGNGWTTCWHLESTCTLRFTVPGAFDGECLVAPAMAEKLVLRVGEAEACWEPGHGYLHIPVQGENQIEITMGRPDGGAFTLSHLFLLHTDKALAASPRFDADGIAWDAVDGVESYHIYRDYLLWDMNADLRYAAAPGEHAWHVAAYHPQRGLGAMAEVLQ